MKQKRPDSPGPPLNVVISGSPAVLIVTVRI
jgi:hypothetical protein